MGRHPGLERSRRADRLGHRDAAERQAPPGRRRRGGWGESSRGPRSWQHLQPADHGGDQIGDLRREVHVVGHDDRGGAPRRSASRTRSMTASFRQAVHHGSARPGRGVSGTHHRHRGDGEPLELAAREVARCPAAGGRPGRSLEPPRRTRRLRSAPRRRRGSQRVGDLGREGLVQPGSGPGSGSHAAPPVLTVPRSSSISPQAASARVVLPAPFSPIRTVVSTFCRRPFGLPDAAPQSHRVACAPR